MLLDEPLGECKRKDRHKSVESIHHTCAETGNEPGLMALAQRLLND